MKNISVIIGVYNEEKRIENFIKSFSWTDDLVFIDKQSTDKTREIAEKNGIKVITIPVLEHGEETKIAFAEAKNEWVLCTTASDIIHPALVKKLLDLINNPDFDYDVISIPFAIYVFGIYDPKRSPWCTTSKELLMKKCIANPTNIVHQECSHTGKKIYKMGYSETENLYHLTHEDFSILLERHTRYARLEVKNYQNEKIALKSSLRDFLAAVNYVLFKKKSFLKGWDGIALGFAYLTYSVFKFIFVWEHFRGKGNDVYKQIRKDIITLWEKEKK